MLTLTLWYLIATSTSGGGIIIPSEYVFGAKETMQKRTRKHNAHSLAALMSISLLSMQKPMDTPYIKKIPR
jgi:hypothetical protein